MSQKQSPWSWGQESEALVKLNALLHYYNLRSRPICLEICFLQNKKVSSNVWGIAPWIRQWKLSVYRTD